MERSLIEYQIINIKNDIFRIQNMLAQQNSEHRVQYWADVLNSLYQRLFNYQRQLSDYQF
jgi:hypothetical protein